MKLKFESIKMARKLVKNIFLADFLLVILKTGEKTFSILFFAIYTLCTNLTHQKIVSVIYLIQNQNRLTTVTGIVWYFSS